MLTYIGLTNFKGMESVNLELAKINIFIGANRTGKSSIFQALALLKQSEDYINWNGDLINLINFEKVLNKGADKPEISIQIKGTLPAKQKTRLHTGIKILNYDLLLRIGANNLKEVTYNINGDGLTFSGVTTDDKPESDAFVRSVGEFEYRIKTTLSVLNKADIQPTRNPLEKQMLNFRTRDSLLEVYAAFKHQLDDCILIPASRGFDKAFYPLVGSYSPNLLGSRGVTAQAEAAASGIASQHAIQRKTTNLVKRVYPDVEVHANIQSNSVEVIITDEFGNEFNIIKEGFGLNQLVSLFYHLATSEEGSTCLIEEPEISLHPRMQNLLSTTLLETALTENKQLLLTTHSEHVLLGVLDGVLEKRLTPMMCESIILKKTKKVKR
jgi:predicted ATP-dependent endonuclease of OLD family